MPRPALPLVVRYPHTRRVAWPLAVLAAGALGMWAVRTAVAAGLTAAVALAPFAAGLLVAAPVLAWRLATFAVRVDAAGVHRRRGLRWDRVLWAAVAGVEDGRSLRLLDARGRVLLDLDPVVTWPLTRDDRRRLATALAEAVAARIGHTLASDAPSRGAPDPDPGVVRVGAARWQRVTMTLLPLGLCAAFGGAFVDGMGGVGGWAAGAACWAFGIWAARAGYRATGRMGLTLDPRGLTFHDGQREHRAAWGDVARCGLEARGEGRRADRSTTVVFRGRDDRELFTVSTQLWSAPDARRWLRYAEARLEEHGARLYGPAAAWPGGGRGRPVRARRAAVGALVAAALLAGRSAVGFDVVRADPDGGVAFTVYSAALAADVAGRLMLPWVRSADAGRTWQVADAPPGG